jgi:hypothetical protein
VIWTFCRKGYMQWSFKTPNNKITGSHVTLGSKTH